MDTFYLKKPPRIRIAAAILQYRRQHGISQRTFGRLVGVSPQAVYKWEHGITYPDITLLPALASLLGVSISSLFGE